MPPIVPAARAAARVSDAGMRRTFDMGLGDLVVVAAADAAPAMWRPEDAGERVFEVGEIRMGARGVWDV